MEAPREGSRPRAYHVAVVRGASAEREGIADFRNAMTGTVIVEAESHAAAAAQIFANHPHFTIFPGDSVEIMECLPMPER